MLEAKFTVCWPSAQILKCPLLFCSLHYHKSNILLAENFKLLVDIQLFMASCCVQNSSFSLPPFHFKPVKHILAATLFFPEVFWHPPWYCFFSWNKACFSNLFTLFHTITFKHLSQQFSYSGCRNHFAIKEF